MALVSKKTNKKKTKNSKSLWKKKIKEARILLPCVYSMFLIIYYSTSMYICDCLV